MTPKIRVYCVLIAALIMTGGSHATASIQFNLGDTVQATLTQSASILGTGNTSFALYNTTLSGIQETWNSSQGGLLGWTGVKVNGNPAPNFDTACIEVLQNVYWGGEATWTVTDLAHAPKPYPTNFGPGALDGMGTGVAALIDAMYKAHYTAADTNPDHEYAGAYQIAIWKLVYDGVGVVQTAINSPSTLFSSNRLRVTASTDLEVSIATAWLAGLTAGSSYPDVVALSSPDFQDQVYGGNAPEPASLAVWSIMTCGAAGVLLMRRHRAA
jgi:hypothetical protein